MEVCVKHCNEDELRYLAEAVGMADETAENYLAAQRRGEGIFLIAWKDDVPVGHAFLKWNPSLPGDYATRVQEDFADISTSSS